MSRILIAGAGALGSVFGGFLRRAGHSVTLLGRPRHLAAIEERGLIINGIWGDHRVDGFDVARSAAELRGTFDSILVTVKAYDTATVAADLARCLATSAVVISLQNGLGNVEAIEDHVDRKRVLAGRVIFGATVAAPGTVSVTVYAEPVLVGAFHGGVTAPQEVACWWADQFRTAGIPADYCEDIEAAIWGKLFYSAALNPLGALLGVHYGALAENRQSRSTMSSVIEEAVAVAQAEGVKLPWKSAGEYRELFFGKLIPATFHHRSSMLQDIERGRRTEVAAINGEVCQRGNKHGIPTPTNELLTRLVQARSECR